MSDLLNINERGLSAEELDLMESVKKSVPVEIDYDLKQAKESVSEKIIQFIDINDAKSVEIYNKSASAMEKADELIRLAEGTIDKNSADSEKLKNYDNIDTINKVIDLVDKHSELWNGATIDFIPEYYDFLIRINGKHIPLGESGSYESVFEEMIKTEKRKTI